MTGQVMDSQNTIAQITGALPNAEFPKVFKLTKPQTHQAITIHLDGASKLDLSAIGNENVTFVHAGDRLVILFDNQSTVTIEPFYDSKGLPLADISVDLSPDRNVSGVEFASLFPITTDQSILPAAGDAGSPASGANFETVIINQFANNPLPLALLGPETPTGNGGSTNSANTVAVNLLTQGPALGVHDVAGNEDRPIALNITDALSIADPRTSLGNLTIAGVPAGVTLSAGTHNADGSWTLTPAQLAGLTLTSDGEVQHFTLTVTGTTNDGTITSVSTATLNVSIAPVADTPTLALGGSGLSTTVSGNEDHAIALPIKAALGEADADAVLSVTISGIPAGVTLSAGTHNADGSVTLTPAQLTGLTLTSDGENQHFDLKVTATTVDGGDAATAAPLSGTFHVNVTPVPQAPTLDAIVTPASINEGTAIALNLVPHFEADADAINTIVVSGLPSNATLNHGTLDPTTGNYTLSQADLVGLTLTAPDDDTKQISFAVTAHAGEGGLDAASSTQQITLAVNPVAEAPTLTATAAASSVNEDSTVALNIAVTPAESDPDATTSVTISGLGTATLVNAAGGTFSGDTVTFTQAQLNGGVLSGLTLHAADDDTATLHLTVTAGTNDAGNLATSAPQTINLTVNPVAEAPGLTATAAAASVNEDSTVALNIAVAPAESDADATTSVTISGLGTATLTNAAGGTFSGDTVTFTQAQLNAGALNGLTLHAADDDTASLHLTVTASTNDAGSLVPSAPLTINLTVNPVADAPTLTTSQLAFQPVAFDVSGATLTEAFGVNAQGTIVGLFEDSTSATHGFVDKGGVTTTFDAPASTFTEVTGINDNGDIVGVFIDKSSAEHGFLETSSGTFSQIDAPGASTTLAFGINDSGTIVGRFVDSSGHIHGFSEQEQNGILIPGTFTQIDVSLAGDTTITATRALGINHNGQIVGLFDDASGEHGFVDTNGVFKAIDVPGATKTDARGIDANGDIVGVFDDAFGEHGFFLSPNGVFTTINGTQAVTTDALGTNAAGEVVGFFKDVTGTHGFSAVGSLLSSNTVSGNEDFPIALGINASLSEADADAAVTKITISGLPPGVSLNDANNDLLSIVNGSITLTPAELVGLTLTSDGETQHFDLTVTATTVDGGDIATAAPSTATLHVNVTPVPDPPTLTLQSSNVSGNEDQSIALGINAALGEIDKDAVLSVAIFDLPAGVSLSDANGDFLPITNGSILLTPAELAGLTLTSDGEVQHFDLSIAAITVDGNINASTFGTLHVDVTPVPSSAPTLTLGLPTALPTTIDASIPGTTVTSTQVTDINDAGHLVGLYRDAAGTHVFEDINGTFTSLPLTGAASANTVAVGINNLDQIVGNIGGTQAFVDTNGTISTFTDANAVTLATGINDSGEIVGFFRDASLKIHGFLDINGHFTTLDVPSSLQSTVNNPQTRALGINNAGEVVGFFQDFTVQNHGFLFNNGKFTTIDDPNAGTGIGQGTEATGINNAGEIVGFFTDASGHTHGFLDINGQFTTIDILGAKTTEALGINDRGQISGFFTDANGVNHGFLLGVSGSEDTAIALPISATLSSAETDPDSVLTVTINGLPSGVTLSDNNHDVITITNGSATLTAAQLNGLVLIDNGPTQHFDLTVTATNTDGGDALTAAVTPAQLIHVDVAPILLFATDHTTLLGTFSTIQAAVDAAKAPGEFIDIGPGTYQEQVIIDPTHGHGANGLTIEGIGPAGSVILDAPGMLVSTGNSPSSGRDIDGLITVSNATGLSIEGVTVNGLHDGANVTGAANPTLVGVAFLSASGTVDHVDVTGIRDPDSTFGDQRGFGIEAVSAAAGNSIAITNSSVEDFQKGGIVTSGVAVDINHDTITGAGATGLIAQNGIQVGSGSGDISGNTISQIGYIPTTDDSTGILFFDNQNLKIDNNTINGAVDGNGNPVSTVGIAGTNSSNIEINGNTISNAAEGIAVSFDSTDNNVTFAPPFSIGLTNVINNATQQGLDFEATDTAVKGDPASPQSFNIVGTLNGNDLFIGGAGHDTFTSGGSGNDTFVYDVANNGTQASIGGTGTDTEIVNGTTTPTTYNINAINGGTELGIHIESGTAPANVVAATVANAQVTTSGIEEIVLNVGNAGDTVVVDGDLSGTGVATHTITINGGTGNDTIDLSKLTSNEDVVANGGGGNDTVDLGFAFASGSFTPILDANHNLTGVSISHATAGGEVTDTFTNFQNFVFSDQTLSLGGLFAPTVQVADAGIISVAAQFDAVNDVLDFNNQTIETNTTGQTVQLTDVGHPGATLNASGNQFTAAGSNETLDLSGWDRAVEIDFAAGTIKLDATSLAQSGSISGFTNVLGTTHNDFFDNLTGGVTVTGGFGAVDHFSLAANVLNSTSIPTITNFNVATESIDLSALLDAKFGPGSSPANASNFVELKEDAGGNSATLEINVNGTPGGTFIAAAHLNGIHTNDVVTAILDHAHTTAQLHAA
jgi:large repetitive protein